MSVLNLNYKISPLLLFILISFSPHRIRSLFAEVMTMRGLKPFSKECWENFHKLLPCSTLINQMSPFYRGIPSVSSTVTRIIDLGYEDFGAIRESEMTFLRFRRG